MKNLSTLFFLLFSLLVFSQTTGSLTFTFTTPKHASGNYVSDGRYVLAVWIETSSGTFVKTKLRYVGGGTDDHLSTWGTAAGCTFPTAVLSGGCNTTDATTGATQTTFPSRTITWDGKNVSGTVNGTTVADGTYRVAIQETWGHGAATATRYITFTKGSAIDSQTPTADANFTAISLKWVPTALGTTDVNLKPELVVAPNPSKGILNLNLKNDTNYITVFTLDGKIVFQEDIKNNLFKNKELDLSFLPNGEYMLSVSNAYGYTNNKIIISK